MTELEHTDCFAERHIGPSETEIKEMLQVVGQKSLDELCAAILPKDIASSRPLNISEGRTEFQMLKDLRTIATQNQVWRSFIGMGYHNCITPPVIQRNVLENPGWYTQYTPYQAEIAQGRLEALLNFQTMVSDLTGLPVANASLLDEATAAAEAMSVAWAAAKTAAEATGKPAQKPCFFVSKLCHPQTIAVLKTRAEPLGIEISVGDHDRFQILAGSIFGACVQYPATNGEIIDYRSFAKQVHAAGALLIVAADILSLTVLCAPSEFGADIAIGSTQRFGVPLGYGGPHAAFLAAREELKRLIPGRIVGVSKDVDGKSAIRLALQTREQHIRREKATSNICTAQVLLAVISSMYAVYHGPEGLRRIANRIHRLTSVLADGLRKLGLKVVNRSFFDTISVDVANQRSAIISSARIAKINLREDLLAQNILGVSLDETTTLDDVMDLLRAFNMGRDTNISAKQIENTSSTNFKSFERQSTYLNHSVFHKYRSETKMLRYLRELESKDLSLTHSMIALGSCTMKLNATAEMIPVTWPEFGQIHPFAPKDQTMGYQELFKQLESWLCEITGFAGVSLQPNAGSQGEYAGLLIIRKYHESRSQADRNICLIPKSAHGTNPASAVMAGMKVIVVDCDSEGNVNLEDLRKKAEENKNNLSAAMITYPSTHGVFETTICSFCEIIHKNGGQVYMDGANMNAQVGLCKPGEFGPDVCHLNLHKTFCIPHGGGGPGMGPIAVASHLLRFLPSHPVINTGKEAAIGAIAAAPWGSASILPISWAYIAMMGAKGLRHATQVAILNANYIAKRLNDYFPVVYKGTGGLVAHECIVDLRQFKQSAGIEVEDVAKRLIDYGFHAPTVSFPVSGTMMIEPTESECKDELDRFCEAMISIRKEIAEIESGKADKTDNVLKNAPHTAEQLLSDNWKHSYSRSQAAYPVPWTRKKKFWSSVGRINNVLGDRTLICTCPPTESY